MGMALVLVGVALLAGYATARLLGLAKGAAALGLMPAVGLGLTAVLTTWLGLAGAPRPLAGVAVVLCCLVGLGLLAIDREWLLAAVVGFVRQDRVAAVVLAVAVLVPVIGMGVAFAEVQAPLSPHDGAFHVETS